MPAGSLLALLARRVASLGLTLLAASFLVFMLTQFSPANVARETLGAYALPEQVRALTRSLRLDDPILLRYARWGGVLLGLKADPLQDPRLGLHFTDPRGARYFGNFGYSTLFRAPVADVLWSRLANTALLGALALAVIVPLSLALGILAGLRPGGLLDRLISVSAIAMTSVPEFALGVILVAIFSVALRWLPGTSPLTTGAGWPLASQLVLPVAVLAIYDSGYVARMVRVAMIEVLAQPYIRTATLKGLSRQQVILRHALRNAMIMPFTVLMLQINWLIGGVVVTELVFAYPGFGRMLLQASLFGDVALIEAATLIALSIAILTQLLSDIGYWLLDPKARG